MINKLISHLIGHNCVNCKVALRLKRLAIQRMRQLNSLTVVQMTMSGYDFLTI